jgi:hypothetical protein
MMSNTQQSANDTDTIRQLVTGYQAARALLAADEINLLHHLQAGPMQVNELAVATKTHEPTLLRFLRALATVDLVVVKGQQVSKGPLADGARVVLFLTIMLNCTRVRLRWFSPGRSRQSMALFLIKAQTY